MSWKENNQTSKEVYTFTDTATYNGFIARANVETANVENFFIMERAKGVMEPFCDIPCALLTLVPADLEAIVRLIHGGNRSISRYILLSVSAQVAEM